MVTLEGTVVVLVALVLGLGPLAVLGCVLCRGALLARRERRRRGPV